jgi:small GTP-binding protein
MSLNETPSANRVHISFFGKRNVGKSSLVNAVTGQTLSVVSDVLGTTTDPVKKAMELLPIGPVLIIDTPGFDDEGELGQLRIKQTQKVLETADIAILVCDAQKGLTKCENQLLQLFRNNNTPYIVVYNKCDLLSEIPKDSDYAFSYVIKPENKNYKIRYVSESDHFLREGDLVRIKGTCEKENRDKDMFGNSLSSKVYFTFFESDESSIAKTGEINCYYKNIGVVKSYIWFIVVI